MGFPFFDINIGWDPRDRDLLSPTPSRTQCSRTGGQLKTASNYGKNTPAAPFRTTSRRLRTMEKKLGASLHQTRTGPSSLGCLRPRRGQFDLVCPFNPLRVHAATSTDNQVISPQENLTFQ